MKIRKNTFKNQDPGRKITFSNYAGRLTQFFFISALSFGTGFRMGKTRPCEFFKIYRPIPIEPNSFIWQPILSAQGDLHGEIPENRFFVITFDWSVLRTSGRPV